MQASHFLDVPAILGSCLTETLRLCCKE